MRTLCTLMFVRPPQTNETENNNKDIRLVVYIILQQQLAIAQILAISSIRFHCIEALLSKAGLMCFCYNIIVPSRADLKVGLLSYIIVTPAPPCYVYQYIYNYYILTCVAVTIYYVAKYAPLFGLLLQNGCFYSLEHNSSIIRGKSL